MMSKVLLPIALGLVLCGAPLVQAQSERAAPGVFAPDAPRLLPHGEVEPAPATRATGGVGAQEVPFDRAQTRSGGPVDGNKTQNQ